MYTRACKPDVESRIRTVQASRRFPGVRVCRAGVWGVRARDGSLMGPRCACVGVARVYVCRRSVCACVCCGVYVCVRVVRVYVCLCVCVGGIAVRARASLYRWVYYKVYAS